MDSCKPQSLSMVSCVLFNMTYKPHHQTSSRYIIQSNCLLPSFYFHTEHGVATLALGSRPKQGLQGYGPKEESPGMKESVRE